MGKKVYEKIIIILMSVGTCAYAGKLYTGRIRRERGKIAQYYHMLNKWLEIRQEGRNLYSYFKNRNCKKIGIYGMKEMGQRLFYELKNENVKVYLIDKKADDIWFEQDIYFPNEKLPDMDIIVITAAYYFDSIKLELESKVKCPIVSIEDVINESRY